MLQFIVHARVPLSCPGVIWAEPGPGTVPDTGSGRCPYSMPRYLTDSVTPMVRGLSVVAAHTGSFGIGCDAGRSDR